MSHLTLSGETESTRGNASSLLPIYTDMEQAQSDYGQEHATIPFGILTCSGLSCHLTAFPEPTLLPAHLACVFTPSMNSSLFN